MSDEYKPGDVAYATVRGVPDVLVLRSKEDAWLTGLGAEIVWDGSEQVTDARRAVVLDLDKAYGSWVEDRDPAVLVERLRETRSKATFAIAYQIEQQTKLSKPPEPTGLGAVVEDRWGHRFVRLNATTVPWFNANEDQCTNWPHIDAARVLSEGVTDAT